MYDTYDRAKEEEQIRQEFEEYLELRPDVQMRYAEQLRRNDNRDIDAGEVDGVVLGLMDRIPKSDAPISFLAHDLLDKNVSYIDLPGYKEVMAGKARIGGAVEATEDYYHGLNINTTDCLEAFHQELPGVSRQSVVRFANFWESSKAPSIIKQRFGVNMLDLNLQDQVNMINFVIDTPWNSPRLGQVQSFFNTQGPEKGIAALRALEFGEDYGDSILSIAEHASPEQAKDVFDTIGSFRESAAAIAGWYESYDPKLAAAVKMAMNERLSDALYAVEAVARDGRLDADVAPHRGNADYENDGRFMLHVESMDEAINVLHGLEHSLRLQHEIVTAPDVRVSRVIGEVNEQFMVYRFASQKQGDALLYVRPQSAKGYDRGYEYGNRRGVEASISFIVNPSDPYHLRSDKDPHGVSIRFDREGRLHDEEPSSEDRDPTREQGSISLDISSGMGDGRHMPVKIGRFIAAGNILRAEKTGSEVSLHHNTKHFEQGKYGTQEGFAKLAIYVAHMAEAMIALQQHGRHGSRYASLPGILRQAGLEPGA